MNTLGPAGKTIIVLVVLGLGAAVWYVSATPAVAPGPVACTADAMQCPDGSYVGRSGPNCDFICPAASSTMGGTSTSTGSGSSGGGFAEYTSGVKGTVVAGPTCPVERTPPDPACADKPLQTNIWISRKAAPQQIIATAQSDKQGVFQLSLPPGDYFIQAGSSGVPYPRCADASAAVGAVGYTAVIINCDTGIR